MNCSKCGVEIKNHDIICPHCHEEFIPDEEPLLEIETGPYVLTVYSMRTTVIDVRQQRSFIAAGGGILGALIVGAVHAAKNHKIEKGNGLIYSIPNDKFVKIAKRGSYISLYWKNMVAKKGKEVDMSFGVAFNKGHRHLNQSWEEFKKAFPIKSILK